MWTVGFDVLSHTDACRVCETDRDLRQRARALKDAVRTIIREELDEDLERICEEIKGVRTNRGEASCNQKRGGATRSCCSQHPT